VGPWLPEPLVVEAGPDEAAVLADSLRLGFLTVLDRLSPVERAVFLLADVFGVPFADIAETVGKSEAACRQIARRARARVRSRPVRHDPGADRAVVDALADAIARGDVDAVIGRLAPDVVCVADGGGGTRTARRPVVGAPRVARYLVNLSHRMTAGTALRPASVNGDVGSVVSVDGRIDLVTAFEVGGGRVTAVRIVRNPDKLTRVGHPPPLS
jgi:RNA polymerase sigma-70 factor (ECF subfamily)